MRLLSSLVVFVLWISTSFTDANASMLINEVDYDQPTTDTAEFVELFNAGASTINLDGYRLDFINGANGSVYSSLDLSGFTVLSGGYFVLCGNASTVANCDVDLAPDTNLIQNGPDAIALYAPLGDVDPTLIDSLAYEGVAFLPVEVLEGSPALADDPAITASLSRLPNGLDTNDNSVDFQLGLVTPGAANVPEPATALLLASGLVGLGWVGRRRLH